MAVADEQTDTQVIFYKVLFFPYDIQNPKK